MKAFRTTFLVALSLFFTLPTFVHAQNECPQSAEVWVMLENAYPAHGWNHSDKTLSYAEFEKRATQMNNFSSPNAFRDLAIGREVCIPPIGITSQQILAMKADVNSQNVMLGENATSDLVPLDTLEAELDEIEKDIVELEEVVASIERIMKADSANAASVESSQLAASEDDSNFWWYVLAAVFALASIALLTLYLRERRKHISTKNRLETELNGVNETLARYELEPSQLAGFLGVARGRFLIWQLPDFIDHDDGQQFLVLERSRFKPNFVHVAGVADVVKAKDSNLKKKFGRPDVINCYSELYYNNYYAPPQHG